MGELKLHLPPEVSPEEATVLLAAKLYERGTLSLGQAAKLAGYSKRAFLEVLVGTRCRSLIILLKPSPVRLRTDAGGRAR